VLWVHSKNGMIIISVIVERYRVDLRRQLRVRKIEIIIIIIIIIIIKRDLNK
jgi:hypothetical protein